MIDTPSEVKQAVAVIWLTIAISALSAVAASTFGLSTKGDFLGAIFTYALLCIVPYKITNRSNATRYVYAVLMATGYLIMVAGIFPMNRLDFWVSIALAPAEAFVFYRLFSREASAWFTSR